MSDVEAISNDDLESGPAPPRNECIFCGNGGSGGGRFGGEQRSATDGRGEAVETLSYLGKPEHRGLFVMLMATVWFYIFAKYF